MTAPDISPADQELLRLQLGREPRGALQVERRCRSGHPLVIRTHPLAAVRGKPAPFPTLYWLTCPTLHKRLAQLEQHGGVSELVDALRRDPDLAARHAKDQGAYAARRWSLLEPGERTLVQDRGWTEVLRHGGIGGIRSRTGIKCLHLQAAYHLVTPTAVGAWIDARIDLSPCNAPPHPGGSAFASGRGLNTTLG